MASLYVRPGVGGATHLLVKTMQRSTRLQWGPRCHCSNLPAFAHENPRALDYDLPSHRIAAYPAKPRSSSRMLEFHPVAQTLHDRQFRHFIERVPKNAVLVVNDSQVLSARLYLRRQQGKGALVEILCLSPRLDDLTDDAQTMTQSREMDDGLGAASGEAVWYCMVRARRLKVGDELVGEAEGLTVSALVEERHGKESLLRFSWTSGSTQPSACSTFQGVLDAMGHMPLPPYMSRPAETQDQTDYQTVYARERGSVAAPTAGLHFDADTLSRLELERPDVIFARVTLHVGAGTFLPMEGATISEHVMHQERLSLSLETIQLLATACDEGKPIVAIGTTSVRALESFYWLGVRALTQQAVASTDSSEEDFFQIDQWDPYPHLRLDQGNTSEHGTDGSLPSPGSALRALVDLPPSRRGRITAMTQLLVVPGYRFALCDALLTNFHQPGSTLLLMVAAFVGGQDHLRQLYTHALEGEYRFLSFGDCCLLRPHPGSVLFPGRAGEAKRIK